MAGRTPIATSRSGGQFRVDYGRGFETVHQGAYRRAKSEIEGFSSRAARTKIVSAERSLDKLTRPQREARSRTLDAISRVRAGASVKDALHDAGATRASLKKYGGDAVRKEGRSLVVSDTDTLARRMSVLTPEGRTTETMLSGRDARFIGQYWTDVKKYALTGDASVLQKWVGVEVTVRGKKMPLVADPSILDALAAAGEVDLDTLYDYD